MEVHLPLPVEFWHLRHAAALLAGVLLFPPQAPLLYATTAPSQYCLPIVAAIETVIAFPIIRVDV